ncbi:MULTISPECIES: hypothetical protein [unclassified Pseudoclavibacter]|uniref:hypothetical protein n=1 Tax=unclassified Pseudoclavibacter TaxID=2615177 RepID=UPI001BAA3868|nr:hypothetical protein [Pseudoclavibacter sp. Marseille-Q4354]MBS3177254.1 hypothetical protein [Pseudoclavibacter sp. Marseille-Q4354]
MSEQQPGAAEIPEEVPRRTISSGAGWRVPSLEDPTQFQDLYQGAAWTVPVIADDENGPEESAP